MDSGWFRWSSPLPLPAYVAGYIVLAAAYSIIFWAMWTNRFSSSVVRTQTERGHHVVQEGPYRFVRHPGYVGAILFGLTTAAVLGSLWALIPAGLMAMLVVVLEGDMEFEGQVHHPQPGQELLIPAGAVHSARNIGSTTARWLYGCRSDS